MAGNRTSLANREARGASERVLKENVGKIHFGDVTKAFCKVEDLTIEDKEALREGYYSQLWDEIEERKMFHSDKEKKEHNIRMLNELWGVKDDNNI